MHRFEPSFPSHPSRDSSSFTAVPQPVTQPQVPCVQLRPFLSTPISATDAVHRNKRICEWHSCAESAAVPFIAQACCGSALRVRAKSIFAAQVVSCALAAPPTRATYPDELVRAFRIAPYLPPDAPFSIAAYLSTTEGGTTSRHSPASCRSVKLVVFAEPSVCCNRTTIFTFSGPCCA